MLLTGAQALIKALETEGVEVVFGLPGGCILPAYDPLLDSSIRHILVRHEQGAGHMAEGYAHVTGRPGVAMVTSGPAATNLVTPLCDAYMDSVPLVAITGQVPTTAIGTDAFQECDTVGITRSVTKHNELVMAADDLPLAIRQAFHIATTGRPGPVLVDVPKDVLQSTMEWHWPSHADVIDSLPGYRPNVKGHPRMIKEAARLILASERPVLYVGGGILKARAAEALRELAELTDIHVVTTLMARGAFPDDHPLCLGMPGMHGNATAVTALQKADLLITLGARFDDRVTGKVSTFAPEAKVIHVDIDPAEQGKVRRPDVPIVGDCRLVIEELVKVIRAALDGGTDRADTSAWRSRISGWREQFPYAYEQSEPGEALKPQFCLETLRDAAPEGTILVSGVGQHQMWSSQYWRFTEPYTWVNSGGLGTMGFSRARRHRGQGRPAGPHRVGRRWGRVLPDDRPGAGDRVDRTDPGQGGHPEQLLPRHGSPVAGDVLRGALQRGVPVARPAGLRQVGRGHGLRGHTGRGARGGAAGHRQGEQHRRPARRGGLPGRRRGEGVPDGAGRPLQRRPGAPALADPVAGVPAMSGPMSGPDKHEPGHHILSVLVENRSGVLARVASLFARRGYNIFSLAVAPTEDERFSRLTIVVDLESAPLEQITKQLFKLIDVVKISELDPRRSVERELLLATVRATPEHRSQVVELVTIFEGKILAVGTDAMTVSLDGHPDKLDDFEELVRGYGIVELQRTGRVALPKLDREARVRAVRGRAS